MPAKSNRPYKRRHYHVKQFQLKFVTRFCLLMTCGAMLMGTILYLFSQHTVTTAFENSRLVIKNTGDYIFPAILMSTLIMLVIMSIVGYITFIFFSHRIAGPIYRLERHVDEVKDGYLSNKIYLRGHDEIKDLATKFNDMTATLCVQIAAIKKEIARVQYLKNTKYAPQITQENTPDALDNAQMKCTIHELSKTLDSLSSKLDYFKTE